MTDNSTKSRSYCILNVKISRYRSHPWFIRLIIVCLFNLDHFQAVKTKDGIDILRFHQRIKIFCHLFTFFKALPNFHELFSGKATGQKNEKISQLLSNIEFWRPSACFNRLDIYIKTFVRLRSFKWHRNLTELDWTKELFSNSLFTLHLFCQFFKKCQNGHFSHIY